jgi:hypothetical protein
MTCNPMRSRAIPSSSDIEGDSPSSGMPSAFSTELVDKIVYRL